MEFGDGEAFLRHSSVSRFEPGVVLAPVSTEPRNLRASLTGRARRKHGSSSEPSAQLPAWLEIAVRQAGVAFSELRA